jgi:RNA polymerase sigma factor (sigma-70 family)
MLRNVALRYYREKGQRNKRESSLQAMLGVKGGEAGCLHLETLPDPLPGPEQATLSRERLRKMWSWVTGLNETHRRIVLGLYYQMSYREIAGDLNLDVVEVKWRIQFIRRQFRKWLKSQEEDEAA